MRRACLVLATLLVLGACSGSGRPEGESQFSGWSRVESDDDDLGNFEFSAMNDLAASSSALVASGDGNSGEVLWVTTDPDAEEWRLVPNALGDGDVSVGSITSYGDSGFVAVGVASDRVGAVWRSEDGTTWQRVGDEPVLGEVGAWTWMMGVASRGSDLVAVGKVDREGEHRGLVWTSSDGTTWSRSAEGPFTGDDPDLQQQMEGVVWTGSEFVAHGWEARNYAGFQAALWASVDGTEWFRAAINGQVLHGEPGELGVRGIAVGDGLLVAAANLVSGPSLLTSSDGRNWDVVLLEADVFADVQLMDIAATSDGYVLVGFRYLDGNLIEGVAFTSTDATEWTLDESIPGAFDNSKLGRVRAFFQKVVAVGSSQHPGTSSQAAIWTNS